LLDEQIITLDEIGLESNILEKRWGSTYCRIDGKVLPYVFQPCAEKTCGSPNKETTVSGIIGKGRETIKEDLDNKSITCL